MQMLGFGFLVILLGKVLVTAHRKWEGLISLDEQQASRQGIAPNLGATRFRSARSGIRNGDRASSRSRLRSAGRSLRSTHRRGLTIGGGEALRLVRLRYRDYAFDEERDWHDNRHCWIGVNARTGGRVALDCPHADPDAAELERLVAYVLDLPGTTPAMSKAAETPGCRPRGSRADRGHPGPRRSNHDRGIAALGPG